MFLMHLFYVGRRRRQRYYKVVGTITIIVKLWTDTRQIQLSNLARECHDHTPQISLLEQLFTDGDTL